MSRNPRRMMDTYQQHHQQQQRPSLSPWEGGFAPGGAGLLPTPSSLLNQFSSTEAQLAVASNLLSSLLRPSQSSMQSNQMPSLMGMGCSGESYDSYGHSMYQDNYSSRGHYQDSPPQQRRSFEYRNRSPVRNAPPKRQPQQAGRPRQARTGSPGAKPRPAYDQQLSKREPQVKKDVKAKDSGEKRGAAFEGLPKTALHCHMCKKNMWDPLSFDNHVRGVAHQKMLGERERAYLVKADLIRHEAKLEEQQNQIEMERLIRMGKKIAPGRREFCKMCDFAFFGDLATHRKSKFHQNLKNFLHPKCQVCHKEFPLRIELDRHVLTPEHLKKAFKDKMTTPAPKKVEGEEGEKMEVEEVVLDDSVPEGEDTEMATEEGGEKVHKNGEKPADEGEKENGEVAEKEEEKSEKVAEGEKLQTYNPDVAVGEEFLMPVTGMFCKACRRFFMHEDQSLQSHCRTLGHFNNCMALKAQLQSALLPTPDIKKKQETAECSSTGGKRLQTDTDTREVKRAKSEEMQQDTTTEVKGELYDPLEASPPTPPEKVNPGSEVDKGLDELVAVINEEGEEAEGEEGEETQTEDKDIPLEEEVAASGDKGSSRARRGRSTRGRGRGKV